MEALEPSMLQALLDVEEVVKVKPELVTMVPCLALTLPPHALLPLALVALFLMEGQQPIMLPVLLDAEEVARVKPELATMVPSQDLTPPRPVLYPLVLAVVPLLMEAQQPSMLPAPFLVEEIAKAKLELVTMVLSQALTLPPHAL
mmetsp:Transcript_3123/g.4291  ORF Transcript_3123/g.4291 Transcript_3123/m.4291 type:complete len:145 (+) Transcript_3123:433-867(+)